MTEGRPPLRARYPASARPARPARQQRPTWAITQRPARSLMSIWVNPMHRNKVQRFAIFCELPPNNQAAAIPTIGALSGWPPIEPSKPAAPKLKIPPSDATNSYPCWPGTAAIPTIGAFSG